MTKKLRGYLITGLVVWLPIFVTVMVIRSIIELLDNLVVLLPKAYMPDTAIPGLGVIIVFAVFLVTGLLVTNFVGQRLVEWGEALLHKIPLVRVIYHTTKQIIQALLQPHGQSFRQVVMIEYPRKEVWTMAFVTGRINHADKELLTVYVPTTPNPTSGFFLMLPETDVVLLDISVENALKVILSLGAMRQPLFK